MTKINLSARILFYGALLSTLIGGISFIFIYLESTISHYLWASLLRDTPLKPLFILGFTLLGGLIVGSLRLKWGNYPQTAHDTIHQLKEHQTVDYSPAFKSLTVALVILIFGAGVGPEAALLGAIVMLSVWQADKLRYLVANHPELDSLPFSKRLSRMLHPTRYLLKYKQENRHPKLAPIKKYIYGFFIFNGLVAFFILMKLTKQPSFISKIGPTHWQAKELLLFIPLLLLGALAGKGYRSLETKASQWFNFWTDQPIKKALLGSLAIFTIGLVTPSLLFSGQTSLGDVPNDYQKFSLLILVTIVLLKLLFLQICLHTGWIGGDIFPIVYSAIILGFGLSKIFPSFDTTFIVAVVATSMAVTILKSPIGVAIFIALFFPIEILPVIVMTILAIKVIYTFSTKRIAN